MKVFHVLCRDAPNGFSGCTVPAPPPELVFTPHFLKIVVEVKTSGRPHVMKVSLGVSKGMLHVKYFCSNKSFFNLS